MRTSTLVSIASLALATSSTPLESLAGPVAAWEQAPQGERVIPRLDKSDPIDGAKRVEKLYGPYTVPAGKMVTKFGRGEAPCTSCYVTAMFATIKYRDGKEALTKEGAWLHHTVLTSSGNGVIWAAGNERPTIRLNSQYKYGIDWSGNVTYTVDIMSEKKEPMTVSMSITYEYMPKNSEGGKKYKAAAMKWIQILNPKPVPGETVYRSPFPTTSSVNGKLLYTIGHMHDGGTNLRLLINDKPVCNSIMFYDGGDKGLVKASEWKRPKNQAMGAHARRSPQAGHGHQETQSGAHIASPGACTNYGSVKKGDAMKIEAYYDFNRFEMQEHEGKKESLMGNCRVYIGPE